MTAATVTGHAALAAEAHTVLRVVLEMPWPQDRRTRRAIGTAAIDLDDALSIYTALADGTVHWEAAYHELRDSADPEGDALDKAAGEADLAARSLITAVAACCGTQAADALTAVIAATDGGN